VFNMNIEQVSVRSFGKFEISRRGTDGFFNATEMCAAFEKRAADYFRSQRTSDYIGALSTSLETTDDKLSCIQHGGVRPGTWIHPRLAIDLARWLAPAFAVWMDAWFLNEITNPAPNEIEVVAASTNQRTHNRQICLMNETDLHYRVVAYLRRFHPRAVFLAGLGELQDTEAKRLDAWAKGYLKGQPDLSIVNSTRTYTGFVLEFKNPGTQSPQASLQQAQTLAELAKLGWKTMLSNDYDLICREIDAYLATEAFRCSCCASVFSSEKAVEAHLLRKRIREVDENPQINSLS
jgi:hypothetical protein